MPACAPKRNVLVDAKFYCKLMKPVIVIFILLTKALDWRGVQNVHVAVIITCLNFSFKPTWPAKSHLGEMSGFNLRLFFPFLDFC